MHPLSKAGPPAASTNALAEPGHTGNTAGHTQRAPSAAPHSQRVFRPTPLRSVALHSSALTADRVRMALLLILLAAGLVYGYVNGLLQEVPSVR